MKEKLNIKNTFFNTKNIFFEIKNTFPFTKKTFLYVAILFCGIDFLGCTTVPKDTTNEKSQPKVVAKVADAKTGKNNENNNKEVKKAATQEEPPEFAFVKQLQTELNNGNLAGAIALFDSIPEDLAKNKDLITLQASLLVSAGRYDDAKKIAKKLHDSYPKDLDILELNLVIAKASGNEADHKLYSDKLLKLDPNNAELNIQIAQNLAKEKKYKQAKASYQKALIGEPENTSALFGYGQMCYYIGEIKEAKNNFQKIIDIDPQNSLALAYLGKLSADGDNYKSAINYIQEAIKYEPNNYNYHMDLGKYYQQLNRPKDAIKEWETARDLDPTYFLAYAYLAGINDERGNFDVALENYRKVIETNPKYYYAYESAAILEWHAGNWAAARNDFMKAWEGSGKSDWSYALMIAATYMKEKNQVKAREWLAPIMKKMNKDSNEYQMVKFYHDNYSKNAAASLVTKINKEENSTKRGKLWFYMGLYNEIYAGPSAAVDMYSKVTAMEAPMFFEYRMAEWGLGINN